MKHKVLLVVVALGLALVLLLNPAGLIASDHDDGETDTKARALNLTDLYAFRERDQNPGAGVPEGDLVFVMNTNPRSVARQQYYFSHNARYIFHVTRVANRNDAATGLKDASLSFVFSEPRGNQQEIIIIFDDSRGRTITRRTIAGGPILTTPLDGPADRPPIVNSVDIRGHTLRVYAGLREDPFFFDVEQFFRVRAGALGIGPAVGFRNPGLDFTAGYNVNAVVVSVPLALLQGMSGTTVFDVWETIELAPRIELLTPPPGARPTRARPAFAPLEPRPGVSAQLERLAQPAINEGLLITNDFLNALNAIGADCEADALAGREPCASAAAPIFAEAVRTLAALGNSPARIGQIVGAFLPDVMRIDTTQPSGYARMVNSSGRPITGRMLLDDVVDITLSVVVGFPIPALKTDNVSYNGPNLGGSRHKPLLPAFPYLAPPN